MNYNKILCAYNWAVFRTLSVKSMQELNAAKPKSSSGCGTQKYRNLSGGLNPF